MAEMSVKDAFAFLDSLPTSDSAPKDRVGALLKEAEAQKKKIAELKQKKKDVKIVAQADWFKVVDSNSDLFEVKIGRLGHTLRGEDKRWRVNGYDAVEKVIDAIVALAKGDEGFRKEVTEFKSKKDRKAAKESGKKASA